MVDQSIEIFNYTLRLFSNYIFSDHSVSFKNNTKTFNKVLCVNFLELFFSTIRNKLLYFLSNVETSAGFILRILQASSFDLFTYQGQFTAGLTADRCIFLCTAH